LNSIVGDFFIQHNDIWYTLGHLTVSIPEWKHICVGFDTWSETTLVTIDGQVLGSRDSTDPWFSLPGLGLGWAEPDHLLRGSTLWSCNDIVSQVDLFHSNNLSANYLVGIKCGQSGNLVAWNVTRWQFDHRFPQLAYSHQLLFSDVCPKAEPNKPCLLTIPILVDFETAVGLCARLSAGRGQLASFTSLSEWQQVWDINFKDHEPENVFMPYRRITSEDSFQYVYDLQTNVSIFWYPGQPNNDNENCAGCSRDGCNNVYCSLPFAAICSFTEYPPRLLLRGNCAASEIDTHYHAVNHGNNFVWMGLTGTFIRYELKNKHWVANVLASDTWAASEVVQNGLALGTSNWLLYENRRCTIYSEENRSLSLTSCSLMDFNCDSGDCILLEERCDGVRDCDDGSDERNCFILQTLQDYNREMSPVQPRLMATVDLLNILRVDETNSKIRLKLSIGLEWFDNRLHFVNLRPNHVQNSLKADEAASIWQPQLIFDNIELTEFDLNVEPAINVVRNESFVFYLNDLSEIYNARVYDGSANRLFWSETVRSGNLVLLLV
jgi:hypothetical protein